jgi:hypothetical protein
LLHSRRLNVSLPKSGLSGFFRSVGGSAGLCRLVSNNQEGQQDSPSSDSFGPTKDSIPTWQVPCGVLCAFIAVFVCPDGDTATVLA